MDDEVDVRGRGFGLVRLDHTKKVVGGEALEGGGSLGGDGDGGHSMKCVLCLLWGEREGDLLSESREEDLMCLVR